MERKYDFVKMRASAMYMDRPISKIVPLHAFVYSCTPQGVDFWRKLDEGDLRVLAALAEMKAHWEEYGREQVYGHTRGQGKSQD